MTLYAQRIAIAELRGWKPEVRAQWAGAKKVKGWGFNNHLHLGDKDRLFIIYPDSFPDYLNDLNAMHAAEELLFGKVGWTHYSQVLLGGNVHATPAQRAEALLKTLGKWDDSK